MYSVFADHAKRFGVEAAVAAFLEDLSAERVEGFRAQYVADNAKIRNGGPPVITAGLEDWYSGPTEHGRYWNALLGEFADWPEQRTASLNNASNVVVAHTPRPNRPGRWNAKGLVVGYVQSGKTTNFTAVIAKMADEGYQLVIVLSGLHNGLRRQTQKRLDQQLKELNPGRWNTLTSEERDFGKPTQYLSAALSDDKIALAVVKKNKTVLTKLVKWLGQPGDRRALQRARVLIIDDEADQASVATTSINPLILQMMKLMPLCTYVGYTATPFANVFIDPASDDLYPKDFILNLPRPDGYFGPEKLFGRDLVEGEDEGDAPDGYDMIRMVPDDDLPVLRPSRKDAATFTPTATDELVDSVHWFWLATAARYARGDRDHSTMLVHTVVDTVVHSAYRPLFQHLRRRALEEWRDGGPVRDRMRNQWEKEANRVPAQDWGREQNTWEEIEPFVEGVVEATVVVLDNSRSKERLNYDGDPVVAIAVGANTLSRGLTLNGLVSSFFVRSANAYDTLLQMGRWFGFRTGYEDLPRIWTTRSLRDDFRHLASVEHEMRDDIDRYQRENLTPSQVAVRILTHPSLAITAKLGAARPSYVSFAGRRLQTRFFATQNADWLTQNLDAASTVVRAARLRGIYEPPYDGEEVHLFRDVPVDVVLEFFRRYRVHEDSPDLDGDLVAAYINKQVDEKPPSLERWSVAVVGGDREAVDLGGLQVGTQVRSRLNDGNVGRADIKTLMSKEDRILDLGHGLTPSQVREISEERLGEMRDEHPQRHDQGLLVIYPIEAHSAPVRKSKGPVRDRVALDAAETVVGLGVVFPGRPSIRNRIRFNYSGKYMSVSLADVAGDDIEDIINRDTEDDQG